MKIQEFLPLMDIPFYLPALNSRTWQPYTNSWFEKVTFKGAFGSNDWIEGWTLLYESGYIKD